MDTGADYCDILQCVQISNRYVVRLELVLYVNYTSIRTHVNRNKDIHLLFLNSRVYLITRLASLRALTASAAVE